uniref:Uncharacterized protein n=1 Tax=Coccidioides posadasii RMSCC 3488 TaxID=454284 RepID=A0A0J6I916_COCPO|nr:hypothetical protein CPAG_04384 [Coccidioides posadasii RMSCC 3488]
MAKRDVSVWRSAFSSFWKAWRSMTAERAAMRASRNMAPSRTHVELSRQVMHADARRWKAKERSTCKDQYYIMGVIISWDHPSQQLWLAPNLIWLDGRHGF